MTRYVDARLHWRESFADVLLSRPKRFKKQFASYLEDEVESDDIQGIYEEAHKAIRVRYLPFDYPEAIAD